MRLEARVNPRVEQRPSQRLEAALSKITRAILNLNSTQYATLSEAVVLDDFEIEWVGVPGTDNLQTILGITPGSLNFLRITTITSKPVISFRCGSVERAVPIAGLIPGKIQKIRMIKASNTLTVYLGNTLAGSVSDDAWSAGVSFDTFGALGSHTQNLGGPTFSARIWKDGDRFTGELVTDLRFDQPDTIYQRNYAVPVGDELVDFSLVPVTALEFEVFGDTLSKTSEGTDIGFVCEVEAGKKYKVRYFKESHEAGSPNFRDEFDNQLAFPIMVIADDSEEYYEFTFEAIASGRAGFNGNLSMFSISNISIKEWSGAILENTLPGDWEEISKKSGDDFWLGVENLVPNGDFSNGVTGWATGATANKIAESGAGRFENTDTSSQADVYRTDVLSVGNQYVASVDVLEVSGITQSVAGYTGPGIGVQITEPGKYSQVLTTTGNGSAGMRLHPLTEILIDNVDYRRYLEYAEGAL